MKISLNWLSDFIEITEKNPQKIAEVLTEKTAEIESFIDQKEQFKNIVIGEIVEILPHPDADKIRLTKTKIGKNDIRQIVCGAKNIKVGQKIPVALEGAVIYGKGEPFEIKKCKIRGAKSNGMLCSAKELGISDDHEGILILANDLKAGANFAETLGYDDIIFEIDNTAITNRADLFSHLGFAREFVATGISLIKNKELKIQNVEPLQCNGSTNNLSLDLTIANPEICPRWCGIEIKNVEIKESPLWIQQRLNACGIRPINNIVDITNFVMLELGMPMHAFDKDKINGQKITMRESIKGEKIVTLDGKVHELPKNAIILEDEKEVFDLCGLMGGESSMVSENTKNLLVHAPIYEPVRIRRAALALSHRTEAAVIYEKSVPECMALPGLLRTIELILKSCPEAKISSKIEDIWPNREDQKTIKVDKKLIDRMIGQELDFKKVKKILEDLEFEILDIYSDLDSAEIPLNPPLRKGKGISVPPLKKKSEGEFILNLQIPPHRYGDICIPEDLAEEVVRIYGFNNIEASPPVIALKENKISPRKILKEKIINALIGNEFFEILNLAFLGPDLLKRAGFATNENLIEVTNPLSRDHSLMRPDLFPRILENAQKNIRYQDSFKLFEIGNIFEIRNNQKIEIEKLSALLVNYDFLTSKAVVESILKKLKLNYKFIAVEKSQNPAGSPQKTLEILVNNQAIGFISELKSEVAREFDLPQKNGIFELNLSLLAKIKMPLMVYEKLPKFPSVHYDLSVLAPKTMPAADILQAVDKLDPLIVNAEILEIFTGKGVDTNQKSVTLAFEFRATDRTLQEQDIKTLENKIFKAIKKTELKKRFE